MKRFTCTEKEMRSNYKELVGRYETSGLTMREFGKQEGLSSSMVSYYVRKARSEISIPKEDKFSQIEISVPRGNKSLKIITSTGVNIEIPI